MTEIIQYQDYADYKKALDAELQKSAESFVRIGYLLKVARDTDILRTSGYANVNDFAMAEYGIDKTLVSRWININDRFAEEGYSDRLRAEYRGLGYSKLAIMLNIPESLNEEITPAYTKSDIQAIKDEVAAEQAESPLETYLEGENPVQEQMDDLGRVIHQILHDEPDIYSGLCGGGVNLRELFAPAGDGMHSVRIQGVGRMMLTIRENSDTVAVLHVRSGEKKTYTWDEVAGCVSSLVIPGESPREGWERLYGEKWPEPEKTEEVAPVQQPVKAEKPKKPKKTEPRKTERVRKAVPKPAKVPETLNEDHAEDVPEAAEPEEAETMEPKTAEAMDSKTAKKSVCECLIAAKVAVQMDDFEETREVLVKALKIIDGLMEE